MIRCHGHDGPVTVADFAAPHPAARAFCVRCEDLVGRVPTVSANEYAARLIRTEPRHRPDWADAVAAVRDAGPRVPPPPDCGDCGDSPPPGGCAWCGLGRVR